MRRFSRRKIFIALAILIIILLLIWAIVAFGRARERDKFLMLYGNVDVRQVDVGFRVEGRVNQLFYEEGDFVEEGCLLAELDRSPYNSQLAQAIASWEAALANFKNADIMMQRRKELIGIGGVTKEDVTTSESNYYQLKAAVSQTEAAVQVAKANLSFTQIFAPSDGIILTRIREPGSVVIQSQPVYTVSVCDPVWIRAFISERDLGKIYFGMDARVQTDSGNSYCGQIGFISPVAEFTPKTVETTELRTDLVYRLRIYVENHDRFLKQGMPVTVKLNLE